MNRVSICTLLCLVIAFSSCQTRELNTSVSYQTGWKTFDRKTTSFAVAEAYSNTPQGMLLIEGGMFTTGRMDEFVTAPNNYQPRSLSVSSFYMDKYEVTNIAWREYEHWISYVFGGYNNGLVKSVRPDTSVWRHTPMAYNEPYEQSYYRHPAYSFYPVVGVSWDQAMAYCQWRTDRVNEMILVNGGQMEALDYESLLTPYMSEADVYYTLRNNFDHPEYAAYGPDTVQIPLSVAQMYGYTGEEEIETDENGLVINDPLVTMYRLPYEWVRDQFVFNTEKYLASTNGYKPTFGRKASVNSDGEPRKVNSSEGLLFVEGYRLPTEAEWEYAAYCPAPNADGLYDEGRIYPWSGYYPRNMQGKAKGQLMANFMRTKVDVGSADGYVITAPVDAFAANDFGLYNMAGNVNEWVLDAYNQTAFGEMSEYSSYRGNVYARHKLDNNGQNIISASGCVEIEYVPGDTLIGYANSSGQSKLDTEYPLDTIGLTEEQRMEVKIDPTDILVPRISQHARVYKGGSWSDRVYWLNPTTRRYLDKDKAASTIGFRCAMTL